MKINQEHLATWPGKTRTAEILGCSEKSVERYTVRGLLKRKMLTRPGRRSAPVYDPESVASLAAQLQETEIRHATELLTAPDHEPDHVPERTPGFSVGREIVPQGRELAAAASALVNNLTTALSAATRQQAFAGKMVLTIKEAGELGFRISHLRDMCRSGTLANYGTPHRPRVARRALEKLLE